MTSIIDAQDLNARLQALYTNRKLLEFINDTQWFDQQVLDIWTEWLKYQTKYPSQPGSIQAVLDSLDTPEFNKGCWELDNGYYREECL